MGGIKSVIDDYTIVLLNHLNDILIHCTNASCLHVAYSLRLTPTMSCFSLVNVKRLGTSLSCLLLYIILYVHVYTALHPYPAESLGTIFVSGLCLPFVYGMATSRSPRILAKRAPQELEVASKETQPLRKRAKLSEGKGMHCKSCRLHNIQCYVFIGSVIPLHLVIAVDIGLWVM